MTRYPLHIAILTLAFTGCAGPGPRMFPVVPMETRAAINGGTERIYDLRRQSAPDYAEMLGAEGRVDALRFGNVSDSNVADVVDRLKPSPDDRHLIVLIDSVPFELVRQLWDEGRFRLFYPPTRTISPFPVMTDLSFSEFFGVSPCPGIEAEFFDGKKLEDGYDNYVHSRNANWLKCTDYHLINVAHAVAYFDPDKWLDHELHYIQKYFLCEQKSPFIGYCVNGSGLGAMMGADGHLAGLTRVDRFCQQIMYESHGHVQITLMSDHGHNLVPSHRAPLSEFLERSGYRLSKRLEKPGDVVVPEFGVVTCGAVYTHESARVAADLSLMDGLDQVMYLDGDEVIVLGRDSRARVSCAGASYRYVCDLGDPLKMKALWQKLNEQGLADAKGFISDGALFEATKTHEYPDAVHRVWRAFHGLVTNQPDVLLTVHDGWHCGSKLMSKIYDVRSAHGNLGPSSYGFAMTTAAPLPPIVRMEDLRAALNAAGVPVNCACQSISN